MQLFEVASEWLKDFSAYKNTIDYRDILEILIIATLVYYILAWMKTTRSWRLLKGVIVICVFLLLAALMEMNTIIWISKNVLGFAVTAMIVVMQPELRHALEQLGQKNFIADILTLDAVKEEKETFSDRTADAIVKACVEMSKAKTGALIVIENNVPLGEYERTGITMDALVSSQLLLNIFEHNTPLHDGAVIIRGDRIVSATCYLPLSDNMGISKELGTRHRAGLGVSENTDSLTVIVSEETGKVSIAFGGQLIRNIDSENLKNKLITLQNKTIDVKRFKLWKGKRKDEKDANT